MSYENPSDRMNFDEVQRLLGYRIAEAEEVEESEEGDLDHELLELAEKNRVYYYQ